MTSKRTKFKSFQDALDSAADVPKPGSARKKTKEKVDKVTDKVPVQKHEQEMEKITVPTVRYESEDDDFNSSGDSMPTSQKKNQFIRLESDEEEEGIEVQFNDDDSDSSDSAPDPVTFSRTGRVCKKTSKFLEMEQSINFEDKGTKKKKETKQPATPSVEKLTKPTVTPSIEKPSKPSTQRGKRSNQDISKPAVPEKVSKKSLLKEEEPSLKPALEKIPKKSVLSVSVKKEISEGKPEKRSKKSSKEKISKTAKKKGKSDTSVKKLKLVLTPQIVQQDETDEQPVLLSMVAETEKQIKTEEEQPLFLTAPDSPVEQDVQPLDKTEPVSPKKPLIKTEPVSPEKPSIKTEPVSPQKPLIKTEPVSPEKRALSVTIEGVKKEVESPIKEKEIINEDANDFTSPVGSISRTRPRKSVESSTEKASKRKKSRTSESESFDDEGEKISKKKKKDKSLTDSDKKKKKKKKDKKEKDDDLNELGKSLKENSKKKKKEKKKGKKKVEKVEVKDESLSNVDDEYSEGELEIDIKPEPVKSSPKKKKGNKGEPNTFVEPKKAHTVSKKPISKRMPTIKQDFLKKSNKPEPAPEGKRKRRTGVTAYMLWCNSYRNRVIAENPERDFSQISKRLGEIWHSLLNKEKLNWKRKAQKANKKNMITTGAQPASVKKSGLLVSGRKRSVSQSQHAPTLEDLAHNFKPPGTAPLDIAAHLALLGESLTIIGTRLTEHKGQIAVQGSLSVLLDSLLCALGPLSSLTNQVPELDAIEKEVSSSTLDNIAYIMPGL